MTAAVLQEAAYRAGGMTSAVTTAAGLLSLGFTASSEGVHRSYTLLTSVRTDAVQHLFNSARNQDGHRE